MRLVNLRVQLDTGSKTRKQVSKVLLTSLKMNFGSLMTKVRFGRKPDLRAEVLSKVKVRVRVREKVQGKAARDVGFSNLVALVKAAPMPLLRRIATTNGPMPPLTPSLRAAERKAKEKVSLKVKPSLRAKEENPKVRVKVNQKEQMTPRRMLLNWKLHQINSIQMKNGIRMTGVKVKLIGQLRTLGLARTSSRQTNGARTAGTRVTMEVPSWFSRSGKLLRRCLSKPTLVWPAVRPLPVLYLVKRNGKLLKSDGKQPNQKFRLTCARILGMSFLTLVVPRAWVL